jgi:Ras-related protein Rab-8A
MAAPPSRSRGDYDHLIKLLLIGDSGACFPPPPHSP